MKKVIVSIIIPTYDRKKQVARCLISILKCNFSSREVIVVDNCSTDGTAEYLQKKFASKIIIVRSNKNLLAGGGRNLGATKAKGKYLLFVDSDNIVDKDMISNLVRAAESNPKAGILGPLTLYESDRGIVLWAGSDINKLTSKTTYPEIGKTNKGQYKNNIIVGHIPNVMMFPRKIFSKVKGFDTENFPMHYEEPDIAERIRRLGYQALCVPNAITYHDTPMNQDGTEKGGLALNDQTRAYFNIRNRIIFMKKYGSNYPLFAFIFLPVFFGLYAFVLLRAKREKLIQYLLLGVRDGLLKKI